GLVSPFARMGEFVGEAAGVSGRSFRALRRYRSRSFGEMSVRAPIALAVSFRDFREASIVPNFLVECFLQQPGFIGSAELVCVPSAAAVRCNLVMSQTLCDSDDDSIADIVCRQLIQ